MPFCVRHNLGAVFNYKGAELGAKMDASAREAREAQRNNETAMRSILAEIRQTTEARRQAEARLADMVKTNT